MKWQEITESREFPEKPIFYFAYGMLTDPKLMSDAKLLGKATLPNYKFEMLQFANVVPSGGDTVYGSLWAINTRILSRLDNTEGYPDLYDRKTVPVYLKDKRLEADVYTMTPNTRTWLMGSAPTKHYVKRVYRGYTNAGIPLKQLTDSLKGISRESE